MFLAQNSPLLFPKRQATSALLKNQNTISPNARIGFKTLTRGFLYQISPKLCSSDIVSGLLRLMVSHEA